MNFREEQEFKQEEMHAYKTLKEEKEKELAEIEQKMQTYKNEIGRLIATRELYYYRKQQKGHKGWETNIMNAENTVKEKIEQYKDFNESNNSKLISLKFDIECLTEIINNNNE